MATLQAYNKMTLLELARRVDPKGNAAVIAEVLDVSNPMQKDAPWTEANNVFSHTTTRRLYLPSGSWRRLNAGVAVEASRTIQVTEGIGMLESYAESDKVIVDAYPNTGEGRMQEAHAFLEGMGQTLASTLIYGNTATDPEKFDGFATRMGALDADGQVIGEGGTGSDLSSIYIVQWGLDTVHMVFPKGNRTMGIEHEDLGEDTNTDSNGLKWQIYRDHFKVYGGLVVKDPRAIARLANIETAGTSNIFDEDNLITIANRMKLTRPMVLYCNRTILSQMEVALKDKTNVNFTPAKGEGLFGEPVMFFRGHPIRVVDAILSTEAAIA